MKKWHKMNVTDMNMNAPMHKIQIPKTNIDPKTKDYVPNSHIWKLQMYEISAYHWYKWLSQVKLAWVLHEAWKINIKKDVSNIVNNDTMNVV